RALAVGRALRGSRGLATSCVTAMTMILPSRPFWVTEPLISPCFCPLSFRYALRAIVIRPLPSLAFRLGSVYAPCALADVSPLGIRGASPAPEHREVGRI